MQSSPPGWLPDPTGRHEFRWFNGQRFTADVSSRGQLFVDPLGAGFVAPAGTLPRSRSMAVAGFVVSAVSVVVGWLPFVFVVGTIGGIVALVLSIIGVRRARALDGFGRNLAVAGIVLSSIAICLVVPGVLLTGVVLHTVEESLDLGEHHEVVDRCDSGDGLVVVEGTITNDDDGTHAYWITVTFSSDGTSVGTTVVYVEPVKPANTARFHAAEFYDEPDLTCTITDVSGDFLTAP